MTNEEASGRNLINAQGTIWPTNILRIYLKMLVDFLHFVDMSICQYK